MLLCWWVEWGGYDAWKCKAAADVCSDCGTLGMIFKEATALGGDTPASGVQIVSVPMDFRTWFSLQYIGWAVPNEWNGNRPAPATGLDLHFAPYQQMPP